MLTNTEYCVQYWTCAEWKMFEHDIYATAEAAKRAMVNDARLYRCDKFRVAVRNVGDWCELNEKGEGQNEHQRTQC